MPPAGSGESDVLSYCTFFVLVLRRRSWFACWWLALPWLLLANMLLGPRGVGGSCELSWVCVCCSRRGLRTQYIRETFSLSCFRRHVLFLGFFGVRWKMPGHALAGGHRDQRPSVPPPRASIVAVKLSPSPRLSLFTRAACMRRGDSNSEVFGRGGGGRRTGLTAAGHG